jgi:hypothetical protein
LQEESAHKLYKIQFSWKAEDLASHIAKNLEELGIANRGYKSTLATDGSKYKDGSIADANIAIRKGAYPSPKKSVRVKAKEEAIILKEETISFVSEDTKATDLTVGNVLNNTENIEERQEPIGTGLGQSNDILKPEKQIKTTRLIKLKKL